MSKTKSLVLGSMLLILLSTESSALIEPTISPESLPNFPAGTEAVANHYSRVGGRVGPEICCHFQFSFRVLDATEFNEVLKLYSKIKHPRLELILKAREDESPHKGRTPKKVVDWSLLLRTHTANPDFDPALVVIKLTVYTQGGNIEWDDVSIPKNLILKDERTETDQPVLSPESGDTESAPSAKLPLLEKGWRIVHLSENEVEFTIGPVRLPWMKFKEGDLISGKRTIDFRWDPIYRLHKVDEENQRVFLERVWEKGVMGWVYKDGRVEMADEIPG